MTAEDFDAPERLRAAPWLAWPETRAVFAALTADEHVARAVGGAVRDTLLGRGVTEIDIATDADPETVSALAARAGLKAVPTGIDHGTVTVVAGGRPFEVTTLRKDVETYGRRARVAFTGDWDADARRRDFTVNALYADAEGVLFDPLGGLADVTKRRVRFIGDAAARIREDYLRILRFFRFVAEFDAPEIDSAGLSACVREHAGLGRLAAERVHGELERFLTAPGAGRALDAMFDHGLLVDVLGGVGLLPRLARMTALETALGLAPGFMRRLAALTVFTAEDIERLRDRFRLSNRESAALAAVVGHGTYASGMSGQQARETLYRRGDSAYRDGVLMAWAADGASADDEGWRGLYDLPGRWTAPEFPLDGADIAVLGVPEGPELGRILARIEAGWIAAGFAADRKALLEEARRQASGALKQAKAGRV